MEKYPEIKLPESRVRRKPQARFGEGYSEKGQLAVTSPDTYSTPRTEES